MRAKRVWYSDKLNLDSPDTIHQILMFGSLKEIKDLKKNLGEKTVKKAFLTHPKKVYTASALNFIKNFLLEINFPIDDQNYLKSAPRNIR